MLKCNITPKINPGHGDQKCNGTLVVSLFIFTQGKTREFWENFDKFWLYFIVTFISF